MARRQSPGRNQTTTKRLLSLRIVSSSLFESKVFSAAAAAAAAAIVSIVAAYDPELNLKKNEAINYKDFRRRNK